MVQVERGKRGEDSIEAPVGALGAWVPIGSGMLGIRHHGKGRLFRVFTSQLLNGGSSRVP